MSSMSGNYKTKSKHNEDGSEILHFIMCCFQDMNSSSELIELISSCVTDTPNISRIKKSLYIFFIQVLVALAIKRE